MIFKPTKFKEVFEITLEPRGDDRGYFERIFCEREFAEHGIPFVVRQSNRSFNQTKGTVRGMHFQKGAAWEGKLITCLSGRIYNIVVDLRPDSPAYKQWVSIELSAEGQNMLHVPKGCANGAQTLTDDCEVLYFMSEFYSPEHAGGINYADPQFNFAWPLGAPMVISPKDEALPFFTESLLE